MSVPIGPGLVGKRVSYRGALGVVRAFNMSSGYVWVRYDNPLSKHPSRVRAEHLYFEEDDLA